MTDRFQAGRSSMTKSNRFFEVKRFFSIKTAVLGLLIILFWIFIICFAEKVAPFDPVKRAGKPRIAPCAQYFFGTDTLGRDVFTRTLYGARVSLTLGIISVAFGLVFGVLFGLIAGFFGGTVDSIIMRLMDALLAIPGILLSLLIIASIGSSIQNVMIAVGISSIPMFTRLVRSNVLTIKEMTYVEAARVVGCSNSRIIFRHILPNIISTIIVLASLQVGSAILSGASLSFLGMGAQPPTPEWGLMTADGREVLAQQWWISTFPGLAILSSVMGINLFGDGLRILLDPRMKVG